MGKTNTNEGILHDTMNSDKILKMTADTMFLLLKDGTCVDIILHTDRWFLQDTDKILGKNIFDLLPSETSIALKNNFRKVISTGIPSTDNYEIQVANTTYFFKCIMYNYDDQHILCQYRDITKRILLKQMLEKTNHQLQEVEKVALIGHWTYNSEMDTFQFSGHFGFKLFANRIKSLTRADILKHIHPDDKELFNYYINQAIVTDFEGFTYFRIFYNRKTYYMRFKVFSSNIENGSKILEGYIQNITDIKENQQKLEMVTRAVSNSTDYIFAMKPNGDIIFGNQRFKEMHGWKQNEDILSYNILDSKTNWISNKRWLEIINQVTSSSQIVSFVINRPIPENQSVQSFDCTSSLIKDSMGKDLVWTFGKDITERVHYEKQVKELNQIMGTVLSNIPLSISVKDITNDLRYIFSNKSGDDFRSGLASHIIGKTDFEIYPREVAENMRTEDMKIIHEKGETRKTIDYTDENGNNIIIDQLRLYINDDFRPFLITIEQDITKNKQMEQELVDAKEKAEESDRLKSAFIANMSHEIRTPLNAIVGFSRIIAETENIEDRKKYYSIVEANNERLLGLINEILDLSKIESGIMEFDNMPIKMSDFGEDIINTMSLRCPKGVELKYMPSVNDLVILCDKNRLSQVFINLIGNAIKFTTEGSISFGYTEKDGYLEFFVKDTGKGISPDKLEKVFDRFVKADNFTQGTGLGLSICKSIVQRMGGEITVSSQQGSGTCFRFTLPDCGVMYVETESSSFQTQNIGSTNMGFTILVAEDTDSNFKLIEAMISKNYKLVRAMNGIEAITLCKDIKPELILMDIKMPELDGLEATQIIREEFPEIPIIAQSAFAFEDDRKRAIDSGCTDFIAKPFTKKQLMDIVQRYL